MKTLCYIDAGCAKGRRILKFCIQVWCAKEAHGKHLQHAREVRHKGATFQDVSGVTGAPLAHIFFMLQGVSMHQRRRKIQFSLKPLLLL